MARLTTAEMEQKFNVVEVFYEILNEGAFKYFWGYLYSSDAFFYLLEKQKSLPKVCAALPENDDFCGKVLFTFCGNPKSCGISLSMEDALKTFFSTCKDQMDEHEFHELVQNIVWMLDDGWDEIEEPTHLRGYAHSLGNIARAAL